MGSHSGIILDIGKVKARQLYADELLHPDIFDSVAWEPTRLLLDRRPRMFNLWYAKQCSGYCGTGQMIPRYDKMASDKCPNCGCFETADHLNRCKNRIRRGLLLDSVNDLQEWMERHTTHPGIQTWLPSYKDYKEAPSSLTWYTVRAGRCPKRCGELVTA